MSAAASHPNFQEHRAQRQHCIPEVHPGSTCSCEHHIGTTGRDQCAQRLNRDGLLRQVGGHDDHILGLCRRRMKFSYCVPLSVAGV